MSKKSADKRTSNLLRLSGIIFTMIGVFHVLRYFEIVRRFDFTYTGSLIVGALLLLLALACFWQTRK